MPNNSEARDRVDNVLDARPTAPTPPEQLDWYTQLYDALEALLSGTSRDPARTRRPDIYALVDACKEAQPRYRTLEGCLDRLIAARKGR